MTEKIERDKKIIDIEKFRKEKERKAEEKKRKGIIEVFIGHAKKLGW